jgi:catalase
MKFDHERIPERVVHARGAGAFGTFKLYESAEDVTHAGVLTDTSRTTPVFLRFSTVLGSRGSADTVRDVRGFAVKFYTDEGNWDIVGNDIPVFFIQDAMKFPDVIHAGSKSSLACFTIHDTDSPQSLSRIMRSPKLNPPTITSGTSNTFTLRRHTCFCGHKVIAESPDLTA